MRSKPRTPSGRQPLAVYHSVLRDNGPNRNIPVLLRHVIQHLKIESQGHGGTAELPEQTVVITGTKTHPPPPGVEREPGNHRELQNRNRHLALKDRFSNPKLVERESRIVQSRDPHNLQTAVFGMHSRNVDRFPRRKRRLDQPVRSHFIVERQVKKDVPALLVERLPAKPFGDAGALFANGFLIQTGARRKDGFANSSFQML